MGLNKWTYQLKLSNSETYQFIVSNNDEEIVFDIFDSYTISTSVLIDIPIDFIETIKSLGIKSSKDVYIAIELVKDSTQALLEISIFNGGWCTTYEVIDNPYHLPDLLENHKTQLTYFSNLFEIVKQGSVSSLYIADKFYGLSENLEYLYVAKKDVTDSKTYSSPVYLPAVRFLYSVLSKFNYDNVTVSIYSNDLEYAYTEVFYIPIYFKLSNKQPFYVAAYYLKKEYPIDSKLLKGVQNVYKDIEFWSVVNLSHQKFEDKKQYIVQEKLENDDLLLFRGDLRILVKDFLQLLYNKLGCLTEVRLCGNMLYSKAGIETICTLYQKVTADESRGLPNLDDK